MKFLKRTLIVLFSIVALLLIVALFVDKKYHVERSVVINRPVDEVFDYARFIKNQDEYSVWNKMDPNMKKTYKGTDGRVGFVYAWDSKNEDVGAGEQEIKSISEGSRIDCELRFKRPYESMAATYLETTAKSAGSTTVEWGIDGETPYPFNLLCLFIDMDGMLGKDLQDGLNGMKRELESGETAQTGY
jgi:hypothetical protein